MYQRIGQVDRTIKGSGYFPTILFVPILIMLPIVNQLHQRYLSRVFHFAILDGKLGRHIRTIFQQHHDSAKM